LLGFGAGLIGITVPVESSVKPISAGVPGKHSTRAVSPMGTWGESYDPKKRARIAEAWNWLSPIRKILKFPLPFLGNALAVKAKPRTSLAFDYFLR